MNPIRQGEARSAVDIKERLKRIIVDELYLDDEVLSMIDDDTFLADPSLGFDSLDVLEMIVLIRERFGVTIRYRDEIESAFRSINTLALFIERRLPSSEIPEQKR